MNKELLYDIIHTDSPTIFEIGAHHGENSLEFLGQFPNCHLYLFEPDKRCIKLLKFQNLHKRAHLFEGVLSDVSGEIDFHSSGGKHTANSVWDGSGSIMQPAKHLEIFPAVTFEEVYKVVSSPLDEFIELKGINSPIDLIWMDVQGSEEKVISGGKKTFSTMVNSIYTEYCNEELYEGCPSQAKILEMLPKFYLHTDYPGGAAGDMFLVRKELL